MLLCSSCGEETSNISVALCKKIFGKKTKRILCMSCLSEHLELSEEELIDMAEDFKKQGCTLFE